MPLTSFQKDVLSVIAAYRSEESHFAGGLVLNAGEDSPRYSHDFDIFHDAAEEVAAASNRDVSELRTAGFAIEQLQGEWQRPSTFRKARVSKADGSVEIDWAADSAYRFFPIERDPILGWRLHLFDMAANKALALASRSVTRDYIDIVELHKTYPLPAVVWAACGKDEGYGPTLLLSMMKRFARIDPAKFDKIKARDIDQQSLKLAWIDMSSYAEEEFVKIADTKPETPIGVAFVDKQGKPGWIGQNPTLSIHRPSIRGCLPTVHLENDD